MWIEKWPNIVFPQPIFDSKPSETRISRLQFSFWINLVRMRVYMLLKLITQNVIFALCCVVLFVSVGVCVFCHLLNVYVCLVIILYHSISYINNVNLSSFDLKIVIYGLKTRMFSIREEHFCCCFAKAFHCCMENSNQDR